MIKGLNIIALDENYEIISILTYTNLQWNRKYYESGSFSIEIPLDLYDSRYKYIYTKDRAEMGEITQINYIANEGYKAVSLSGYFLENQLNKRVVYKKGASNIVGAPTITEVSGNAETVAYTYFNNFKNVSFTKNGQTVTSNLNIEAGTNQNRGKRSVHNRNNEYLGDKIYQILKPSEMSYRVSYDFLTSKKIFSVWSGLDRTQDNLQNNPVIFSTRYGNIKNPNILIDKTSYKNGYVAVHTYNEDDVEKSTIQVDVQENAQIDSFLFVSSGVNKDDYDTENAYITAIKDEASQSLEDYKMIINVSFIALEGSYDYMTDFDLGDKCSIEIPEMNISADSVLIGCYEVIKKGVSTISLEFGTPILKK